MAEVSPGDRVRIGAPVDPALDFAIDRYGLGGRVASVVEVDRADGSVLVNADGRRAWVSAAAVKREYEHKRALVDDYNAVVDALNPMLGDDPLPHAEVSWREPATELTISLDQLRRLLEALGAEVPR